MDSRRKQFLLDLLQAEGPSGFEEAVSDVWTNYVEAFADDVYTDAYGNVVAVYDGDSDVDTGIAVGGHADEIGFMVRSITGDGQLQLSRVGWSDNTVSQGQRVIVHADDERVRGVVGQTAIFLRERGDSTVPDIAEQHVDIGAEDEEEARELVSVGDPITVEAEPEELHGSRMVARAFDNRAGVWTAAEVLRRAAENDVAATVYAVSTVQEELGFKGATMVGYDLEPDMFVAVDVTHATDSPGVPGDATTDTELSGGPTVARGSASHPSLVEAVRGVADDENIDYQLEAAASRTETDSDAIYTSRGGIPSLRIGVPNRYMHTPVEVVDTEDLDATAELLTALVEEAPDVDI